MLQRVRPSRFLPACVLGVAACAGPAGHGAIARPVDQPVAKSLPSGATVRLEPVAGSPPASLPALALDGWLREALRQSAWLDIAAGPVAGPSKGATIAWTFDAAHGSCAADLDDGGVRTHLAAVPGAGRAVHQAIDELALRIRIALGDPIEVEPEPVANLYSADAEVTAGVERALDDARSGDFAGSTRRLQPLRRRDGACAFLLELQASNASLLGDATGALRLAQEALGLERRRSPTTTHRLLRTLLLTRASADPRLAARFDEELRTLAQVAERERPHDPEVRLTAALAHNFLGEFAAAQPLLVALADRLPQHAGTLYHLGWAALGNGDARTARRAFDEVAATLPTATTVVPRALARFAEGDHAALRTFLAQVADEPRVREGAALHEIRRMQAAHELLCRDVDAAADFMLADLAWLVAHPSAIEIRAGELADAATVLVLLGRGERMRPLLASIATLWPDTPVADAATYASGLLAATASGERAIAMETALQRRNRGFWGDALAAYGHRLRGERTAEQSALASAARQSESPMVKAALIENLRATGHAEEARTLGAALRRELASIQLRRRCQSPLLGPELAFAWLVAGDDAPPASR